MPVPLPFAQRVVAAAFGALALLLAAAAASALLSSLYASATADVVRHSGGRKDGVAAARVAVSLAPWRTANHRYLAQSLSAQGSITVAIEHSEAALRGNPADGYAWAYLARLVGAQPPLQTGVLRLYQMALSRSPDTPALHEAIALDGVLRWRFGDAALHELWRDSMAYTLRHDRKPFLLQIMRLKRDLGWCAAQRGQLPIDRWCANVERIRIDCAKPGLPPKAQAWCRNFGMTSPPP